jgi:rod shape-determining protein MreD
MALMYIYTGVILMVSLVMQGHPSFDVLRIGGVKPDLVFIAIVYFAYNFGSFYSEVCAFISGFFHDASSNAPLGLLTLPKVIVAFAIGFLGRDVMEGNILTIGLLVFVASLIKGVITIILCLIFHESFLSYVTSIILPEAFFNGILAPMLFYIFDKIFDNYTPVEL